MTPESRQLLAGRFSLDSRIGAGNYAEVFRATDTHTGELVAVKRLRPEHAAVAQTLSLFENEGKAGTSISDPNVVKISSYGEFNGTHFIVMELVKGISLRRRLTLAGPLAIAESLRIIAGVLRGLDAIHGAGYVHRDIKPQNILIDASGTPKITDFGITLCPGESSSCSSGLTLGTAAYIAPEQAAGRETGPQADIYSTGAVLFEMLTGETPFPGDDPVEVMNRHLFDPPRDPRALNPEISPALSAIVLRALAKDPGARFGSAQRMREALEMLQDESNKSTGAVYRRFAPANKSAWTASLVPSRQVLPPRIAHVPILTTVVSALLLIVLVIVVILALVSTAVNASSSRSRISSSSPPSGDARGPTLVRDSHPVWADARSTAGANPNWPAAAVVRNPTPPANTTNVPPATGTVVSLSMNRLTPVADQSADEAANSEDHGKNTEPRSTNSSSSRNPGVNAVEPSNQTAKAVVQDENKRKGRGTNRHGHD